MDLDTTQSEENEDYVKDLRHHLKTGFAKQRNNPYHTPMTKKQVSLLIKKRMAQAEIERKNKKSFED